MLLNLLQLNNHKTSYREMTIDGADKNGNLFNVKKNREWLLNVQIELKFRTVGLYGGRKTRGPGEKPNWSKVKTSNKLNPVENSECTPCLRGGRRALIHYTTHTH